MAKYDPIFDWLSKSGARRVSATFKELDELIGNLPMSARKYPEWWANEDVSKTSHTHCISWQNAGFKASADLADEVVVFERD